MVISGHFQHPIQSENQHQFIKIKHEIKTKVRVIYQQSLGSI